MDSPIDYCFMPMPMNPDVFNAMDYFPSLHQPSLPKQDKRQAPFTPLNRSTKSPAPARGILTLGEGPESGDEEMTPLVAHVQMKGYVVIEEEAPPSPQESVSVDSTPQGNGSGDGMTTPPVTPEPSTGNTAIEAPASPQGDFVSVDITPSGTITPQGTGTGDEETTPLMTPGPRRSYAAIETPASPQDGFISVPITPPGSREEERVGVTRQASTISSRSANGPHHVSCEMICGLIIAIPLTLFTIMIVVTFLVVTYS